MLMLPLLWVNLFLSTQVTFGQSASLNNLMVMMFKSLAGISHYAEKQPGIVLHSSSVKAIHRDTSRSKLLTSTYTWTSREDHCLKQNHIKNGLLVFPASKSKIMCHWSIMR